MHFREISKKYFNEWVEMGADLWPNHTKKEIEKEFSEILKSEKETAFLCKNENYKTIAFINLSIRSDYVEGSTTSPVG